MRLNPYKLKTFWPFFVTVFFIILIFLVFFCRPFGISYNFIYGSDNNGDGKLDHFDGKTPLWIWGETEPSLEDGKLIIVPTNYELDANGEISSLVKPWFTILFGDDIRGKHIKIIGDGTVKYSENIIVEDQELEYQNVQIITDSADIFVESHYPVNSVTFYLVDLEGFTFYMFLIY